MKLRDIDMSVLIKIDDQEFEVSVDRENVSIREPCLDSNMYPKELFSEISKVLDRFKEAEEILTGERLGSYPIVKLEGD